MRVLRGLRKVVMRLMVPPLPAASRPSKITSTGCPGFHVLLQLHQFNLQLF
jgi:hypothetical protein